MLAYKTWPCGLRVISLLILLLSKKIMFFFGIFLKVAIIYFLIDFALHVDEYWLTSNSSKFKSDKRRRAWSF